MLNFSKINILLIYLIFLFISSFSILNFQSEEKPFIKKKVNLGFSIKGPGGGYNLSKAPNKIKISEIINGVEENIRATGCSNDPSKFCTGKNEKCITHHFLEDLESLIENYLDSVALSDIALNKENNFLGLNQ